MNKKRLEPYLCLFHNDTLIMEKRVFVFCYKTISLISIFTIFFGFAYAIPPPIKNSLDNKSSIEIQVNNKSKEIDNEKSHINKDMDKIKINALTIDENKSTAVFYGANLPTEILSQYSRIIVESGNVKPEELTALQANNSRVFAYVSIGEVSPSRPWFKNIKKDWILGDNKIWDSKVMNLASTGWQDFILDSVVTPLWEAGYRGLFLDTMDSFYLFAKDPKEQEKQANALVALLQKIQKRYPDIRFISNRGFEVLPSIGDQLEAVVAESLFASWDNGKKIYKETSANDQEWLLNKLKTIKNNASVDIIIIDYVEIGKHDDAKKVAKKIEKEGFIPWVSIPSLDLAGVGSIEPEINTYLLLFDSKVETNTPLKLPKYQTLINKIKSQKKVLKTHDIQTGMPLGHMGGRYKSILSALPYEKQPEFYKKWLKKQIKEGVSINMLTPKSAIPDKE
ncbi:MAG: hypothetical protein DSZ29_03715 [Aquificaceae bacterium]|nr:MAG: hypothetical protein DSZ29_03715 [Aquificaceae bacterium]